jgi:soluble lytic murein transglycosylase-like protein
LREFRSRLVALVMGLVVFPGCAAPTDASPPPPPSEAAPATIQEALVLRVDASRYEAGLAHLVDSDDPATSLRARYLLARHFAETKRASESLPLFSVVATESGLLAPWALVDLALAAESTGSLDAATAALRRVLDQFGSTAAAPEARTHVVRILAKSAGQSPSAEAAAAFESAMAKALAAEIDEQTEPLLVALADSLEALKLHELALRVRMRLLEGYPRGRQVETVFAKIRKPSGGLQSPLDTMSAQKLDALAERLARHNRLDQALELLAMAEKREPSTARRDDATAIRARVLFRARKYGDVTAMKPSLTSKHYEEVQYLRALAYWRSGRNELFLQTADRLVRTRPSSSQALEARVLVAKYHAIDEKDFPKAAKLMKAAVERGAAGNGGENLWLAAWYEIMARLDPDALATLEAYLARYPNADYTANALFWKAKLLDANGDVAGRDSALARLATVRPYDYFTWRARELGFLPADPPRSIESGFAFPGIRPASELDDIRIRRALELEAVALVDRAALEWRLAQAANRNDPSLAFGLADLYARAGQTSRSMRIAMSEFRDVVRHGAPDVPQRFWELLYPRAHWELITRESERNGVDPWLVSSIIRQESAFEPTVVSSAGAVGLMQIMPNDASRMAASAGLGRTVRRADLFDVETSIRLGTHELASKQKKMNDNEILAIAAYNAGEGAVSRWVADMPPDDIDRFIESIPYPETRLYVKIVLKNRHEYKRVYGE